METTARGAAYLAGLVCGFYKDLNDLRGFGGEMTVFFPRMDDAHRAEKLLAWEEALGRDMYRVKK